MGLSGHRAFSAVSCAVSFTNRPNRHAGTANLTNVGSGRDGDNVDQHWLPTLMVHFERIITVTSQPKKSVSLKMGGCPGI